MFSNGELYIPNYTSTSFQKSSWINGVAETNTDATATFGAGGPAAQNTATAAISSMVFGGTTWQIGTTIRLYGIKNL
jgi:hypothetical protein